MTEPEMADRELLRRELSALIEDFEARVIVAYNAQGPAPYRTVMFARAKAFQDAIDVIRARMATL